MCFILAWWRLSLFKLKFVEHVIDIPYNDITEMSELDWIENWSIMCIWFPSKNISQVFFCSFIYISFHSLETNLFLSSLPTIFKQNETLRHTRGNLYWFFHQCSLKGGCAEGIKTKKSGPLFPLYCAEHSARLFNLLPATLRNENLEDFPLYKNYLYCHTTDQPTIPGLGATL